ncbi:uncharacterized protein LOC141528523 [Cotesia typhae]|uniref:uncharacterized protein LOC141528523 n=1 Tax=Cotesia typhae TaxID=2053667 RepID=UPI003D69B5AC
MNFHNSFSTLVWIFIIVKLNVSFVASKIVPLQKGDARDWRETGDDANLAKFNNYYSITIDEEQLNSNHYSTGKCNGLTSYAESVARTFEYPNQCRGKLLHCWLFEETQKRKDAQHEYDHYVWTDNYIGAMIGHSRSSRDTNEAKIKLDHTGNTCKCLCNRLDDSNSNDERGKLVDSICLDPVLADNDHVVTGVRFNRHDNVIYLELQQAKLKNYPTVSKPEWKISYNCKEKKYIDDFTSSKLNEVFSIVAEDFVLSENVVVTGVTLGESLRGRYINSNGNFDTRRDEFESVSKYIDYCAGFGHRMTCLILEGLNFHNYSRSDVNPRVPTATKDNYERSEPCKSRIFFRQTSATENDMQAIVPYIDLQEIVTDPPEPIHGVGWYLRGFPGYGGFLALKIFKKV